MVAVEQGATTYQDAFYDVSRAYVMSAEEVAKCNIRLDEAKKLQELRKQSLTE